jgi:hypothetical protein
MLIDEHDRSIVRWAMERAYPFEYCRQNGLPEPCLRVYLGLSRAYFHKGKLIHLSAESPGNCLDQFVQEMALLFAMCTQQRAYVDRRAWISPPDYVGLGAV